MYPSIALKSIPDLFPFLPRGMRQIQSIFSSSMSCVRPIRSETISVLRSPQPSQHRREPQSWPARELSAVPRSRKARRALHSGLGSRSSRVEHRGRHYSTPCRRSPVASRSPFAVLRCRCWRRSCRRLHSPSVSPSLAGRPRSCAGRRGLRCRCRFRWRRSSSACFRSRWWLGSAPLCRRGSWCRGRRRRCSFCGSRRRRRRRRGVCRCVLCRFCRGTLAWALRLVCSIRLWVWCCQREWLSRGGSSSS